MYSRGYERGIESDGVLREMERRYLEEETQTQVPTAPDEHQPPATPAFGKGGKKLFSRFDTEDLLIIAIAVLLLLDGEPDNDIIIIALAFLLLF